MINLYSATYPIRDVGGSQIFMKQLYWFLIGYVVLLIITTFDYHVWERLAYPAYTGCLALLILVLIVGRKYSGVQRWLYLGSIGFQPSELAKIALVITLAKYFTEHGGYNEYGLRDLWRPFLLIIIPGMLIIKEPDLGSALILMIVAFIWFTLEGYQQKRILSFLKPAMDPLGAGYHINQSKIAVGSGHFWGKGFLKGTQTRLHFLPEQHTDFVFSVWAEEWGFMGSVFLLMLYLFLILWGINIAKNSKDKFGSIAAFGIVAIIFWQLVINVSMAIGLVPVVGIPLVMFSYGGSSVISTMAGVGLLMNISMRRFTFQS
jgi:rod shape determining protein RodA